MNYLLVFYLLLAQGLTGTHEDAWDPSDPDHALFEFAHWAPAGSETLTLEEVIHGAKLDFRPLESENHALGFSDEYYWLRFRLFNPHNEARTYYLQTARPVTDRAVLYQLIPGGPIPMVSGDRIPFSERQVPHRATVFEIVLPPGMVSQFYMELKSDGETLNLPLDIYTEPDFWKVNYSYQLFLGFFYGLLLLAGIIYLFFYQSLQERSFFYYGIYVLSIFLMQATLDGLVFQYAFPEGGFLNARFVLISALICNFYLLKYCETFLRIKEVRPTLCRAYLVLYIVIGILTAATFTGSELPAWLYPASNLNGLISLVLILVSLLVMKWRDKIRVDPFFTIGICFLVIGLLGFVLNNLSVLPNNFLTLNAAKFGSGFEVIFLSLSMTNRIRDLRRAKEQSQDLALQKSEEISQIKTSFMSNMSHELRTPLNLIMGIVQDGMNTDDDPGSRRELSMIRDASLSLLSNINDILDFEKIESGTLRLRDDDFDPAEALEKLGGHWQEQALAKGLSFSMEIASNLPSRVHADQERMLQIVNNVLSNAIKYTHSGAVQLSASCREVKKGDFELEIHIRDTGIGIEDEKMPHIFDSFSQMRLDNKRNFGGIGLGLCIARSLVDAFGGTIGMDSKLNLGTHVTIILPVRRVVGPGTKPPTFDSGNDRGNLKNYSVKDGDIVREIRVLVVEDNKMNQMVIKKLLAKIPGIRTSFTNNGQECLEVLGGEPFDLVLMDLQMPVMDGYEATEAIRSGKLGAAVRDIPIIAVTADTTETARSRVMQIGMQDYISKPVDLAVLRDKLEQYRMILAAAG